jgi:hypothetical protein
VCGDGTGFDESLLMRSVWIKIIAIILAMSFGGMAHACCIGKIALAAPSAGHQCCPAEKSRAPQPSPCHVCQQRLDLMTSQPPLEGARLTLLDVSLLQFRIVDEGATAPAQNASQLTPVLISPLLCDLFHSHCLLTT